MQQAASTDTTVEFPKNLTDANIRVTPAAGAKLAELIADEDDVIAVRIFVGGGGCGGMSYGMTFTDAATEYDVVYQGENFALFIDAVALGFLAGIEIDFVERPGGASFVFNNAFAATGGSGTCGACGSAGGGCA
jgi:iron-sulfur cluster insertion protein